MRITDVDPSFLSEGSAYFVDMSTGKPMVKSGNGLTPIVASKIWWELTPELVAKAQGQGFRAIDISVSGQVVRGLEGGGKVIVSPRDFQTLSSYKPQ